MFTLSGVADLGAVDSADTLIAPNRPDPLSTPTPAVLDAVRGAPPGARGWSVSVRGPSPWPPPGCSTGAGPPLTGAGREPSPSRYPDVLLQPDVLFVSDGNIHTAAGSAAALDLGLQLIRLDHGAEIANAVSRRLVFAAHRDGGQRQFVERPVPAVPDTSLGGVLAWAQERLDQPLAVADLAHRAAVSPATLHRRFQEQLGTTPLAWLTSERVALACRLIERGEAGLDRVARLAASAPRPTSASGCAARRGSALPRTAADSRCEPSVLRAQRAGPPSALRPAPSRGARDRAACGGAANGGERQTRGLGRLRLLRRVRPLCRRIAAARVGPARRLRRAVRNASQVRIDSASHTSEKPAHRSGGIASWKYRMPSRNWKTGARYWSRPSVESRTRIAAAPKQTSGMAVIRPVDASRATWPAPSVPIVAQPWRAQPQQEAERGQELHRRLRRQ